MENIYVLQKIKIHRNILIKNQRPPSLLLQITPFIPTLIPHFPSQEETAINIVGYVYPL